MASPDPVLEVFEAARRKFQEELPQNSKYRSALDVANVDEIYDEADRLQKEQAKTSKLRHLNRIATFLRRLEDYAKTIEVFVQAKPEILALIWGPIKLLLLWTSEWREGLEAIVRTMERIGEIFPQFKGVLPDYVGKQHIGDVLGLLYKDILDFYLELLKFFGQRNCRGIFEMVWSRRKVMLKSIEENIEKHARLLGENITFEHIRRADEDRRKMFAEFNKVDAHQVAQKFRALETSICARMYDDKLEWLRRRTYSGTANWLLHDPSFRQWMDMTSQSADLLWLVGIPGAGKTFLSSRVVDEAANKRGRKKGRVLYAFPAHTHADTTAISVVHSLLFQMASEDKDLQSILTESSSRDLKSNLVTAQDLLTTALKCAGEAVIVVDGLDEVDLVERKLFLTTVMKILKDCNDMALKVCISSRPEDDIARIIGPSSMAIRVDRRNTTAIQAYVNTKFYEWMEDADFTPKGRSEIQALLSPVSTKANGMFLYARIVIDNVVDLTNIAEIRKELNVLPEDLDDAYKRVVLRIERQSRRKRSAAKIILGWIGCSPGPVKMYELEQAVLVGSGTHDDAPTVDSALNIVKLCGPIVEVADGTPQFVHFTVKEYIFDKRSSFLDRSQCTLEMLSTCLTYLCYDALQEPEEDELQKNILSGKYRLQVFASSSWFNLVMQYLRSSRDEDRHKTINRLISKLFSELANPSFKNDSDASSETANGQDPPDPSRLLWPDAAGFLADTVRFHDNHRKDEWTLENAETWVNLDPLTISNSCAKVEHVYGNLLREDVNRLAIRSAKNSDDDEDDDSIIPTRKLRRHYGMDVFKCCYYSCSFRRHGFETYKEWDNHIKKHKRPWKCPVKTCDFSVIGYPSADSLERHRLRVHRTARDDAYAQTSVLEDEALYPLMYELVNSAELDELKSIWPGCRQKVNTFTKVELLTVAAGQGSLPMVQLLLRKDEELKKSEKERGILRPVINNAIQSGNLELIHWVLRKVSRWRSHPKGAYRDVVVAVLKSDSAEVFDIWKDVFIPLSSEERYLSDEIFEKTVLRTAKRFPEQEQRLFKLWESLVEGGAVRRRTLSLALTRVAQTTYSTTQATELLKLGAGINYPVWDQRSYTALQWACNGSSKDAAEFVRFLLLEGASPLRVGVVRGQGVRNIETWLGMTWDDLKTWADEERKRKNR